MKTKTNLMGCCIPIACGVLALCLNLVSGTQALANNVLEVSVLDQHASDIKLKQTADHQQAPSDDLKLARDYYAHGSYEEALKYFLNASHAEPDNAKIHYAIGLTYQGMLSYDKAEKFFAKAVKTNPGLGNGWAHLGEMLYRKKNYIEARSALEKAERNAARVAYTAYIKGLVLIELSEYDKAIQSLQQSKSLEPALAQKATYAMGMAYQKKGNKKAAKKAFREAVAMGSESAVGIYADFGLKNLTRPKKRLWHVSLDYTFQYDDNVLLNPDGAGSVSLSSNQADYTHVLFLQAGYKPDTTGSLSIRADASYYRSTHQKLTFLDVDGFTVSVTPGYAGKLGTLSLESRLDYYLVGSKRYLRIGGVYPSFGFDIGKMQHSIITASYQKKQYANQRLSIPGENRDSNAYSAGLMHFLFSKGHQGYASVGYIFDIEHTKGVNWGYTGHKVFGSLQYPLGGFKLHFDGGYYIQDYRNVHLIFGKIRHDTTLTLSPSLTYHLKWANLHLQYTYIKATSNISVFQYSENISGAGIEFNY